MFLKSVTMDGFKCYSTRTVINNIDRSFTAITGLNGSGKSNIIDAVIFALDLGTSKLMRVSSLRELINIQRKECSVTLTFNNKDKSSSPGGYEHYDVIEVTRQLDGDGKSKFRMNGHNCTRNSIEMMCKSVGITSDFIVMQGRITKIVNMKGSELRSMVEEVAGTRSYNMERARAREELEKKEIKLRESREYLQRNINPFLNELLREKKIYEDNRDFESQKEALTEELRELECRRDASEMCGMVLELMEAVNIYAGEKAELDELNGQLQDMDDGAMDTDIVGLKSRISEEMLRIDEYDRQRDALKKLRAECSRKSPQSASKYNKSQLLEKERILSKEASGGLSSNRIEDLERLKATLHSLDARHKHLCEELKSCCNVSTIFKGGTNSSIEIFLNNVDDCSDGRNTLEGALGDIKNAMDFAVKNRPLVERLSSEVGMLRSRLIYPQMDGVYGTVDENFDLVDTKYKESIFTILGGRAKFIICADDGAASEVLRLSDRRVSCIPLNKIAVSSQKCISCSGTSAIGVIRYDPRYDRAYRHIFNNYYIFEDKSAAYECCYKHNVMCVTLDGTVYDPRGTLTGGKVQYKCEIVRMRDILEKEQQLFGLRREMLDDEQINTLKILDSKVEECREIRKERECTKTSIGMLEKICGTGTVDIRQELANIRSEIIEATKEEGKISLDRQRHEEMLAEIREMEMTVRQNEVLKGQSERLVGEYQRMVREAEIKVGARNFSAEEGAERRKEHLIKSTVKLSGRMKKQYEMILQKGIKKKEFSDEMRRQAADRSLNKENEMNGSNGIMKPSCDVRGCHVDEGLWPVLEDIGIESSVLSHLNGTEISQEAMANLNEKITRIRSELSVKRQRSTMDPGSFELLEKNVAVIKDIEAKISRLEQDKVNIMASMTKLTELGMRENEKAFSHINKNIQKFFRYFIKNAEISIGSDYEIKVSVGEWKNSISELSGGQRSLIALCLIFSMLSYRTAPFYIFDEIDAALDLNYTQGIGEIIQREFKNSQFLVISLKNNMFENANKIFRVYIQNGKPCIMETK